MMLMVMGMMIVGSVEKNKIRKHWLALFVSHPLACLAVQKAQEGKSRRVRVQVIISMGGEIVDDDHHRRER